MSSTAQLPKNRATLKLLRSKVSTSEAQVATLDAQRLLFTAEAKRIQGEMQKVSSQLAAHSQFVDQWVGVFSDTSIDLQEWVTPVEIITSCTHVGKVVITTLEEVIFPEELPDPFSTPLWVDDGVEAVRTTASLRIRLKLLKKNFDAVEVERKRVTRLYNYLDKILIPALSVQIQKTFIALDDAQREESTLAKVASDLLKRKVIAA
ncbi:hypothetical protein HN960_01045 [Candidatus Peregrinibacteria bacterium]|jgi:vacuolar-type H+-ATPase subunit D/Vma8|nr:hypothetical protein [Candidatus Peregrinibacteria bacterium]MBT4586064.1 hypothetical protein [Candidatus Peregrinibacteria bacterium]MBT6731129.1 hypothetical protein [Candidatus Peregrinibacteria bacterium]MBT7009008.1 hypothetical protein [Candidatus Peregrinibacteria bacterium]MBT7345200.1 hypothetical protein [Candidatus Peregrinibacteria bacterium]